MQFSQYDWYNIQGKVSKGVAATPGGIDLAFEEHIQADRCRDQPREAWDSNQESNGQGPTRSANVAAANNTAST